MARTSKIVTEGTPADRALDHREMHAEHRYWRSDTALWNDELQLWQQELQTALADMHKLEDSLKEHQKALAAQAAEVAADSQQITIHEQALADYERGESQEELIALSKVHQKEAEKHRGHWAAQERVKKHHHQLMAHWNVLLKALTAPM